MIRGIIPTSMILGEWILTFINTSLIFILSVEDKSLGLILGPGLWGFLSLTGCTVYFLCLKKLYPLISLVSLYFTWFWALFLVITIIKFLVLLHHLEKKSFQKTDFACFYRFCKTSEDKCNIRKIPPIYVYETEGEIKVPTLEFC